jgi:UDP-GlcNAc3NAcA epimerase
MMRIVTVVGARPQFVKAAVISRVIRGRRGIEETLVHTGQHHDADLSDVFFDELEIGAPAHNLGLGGGTHGAMTGKMLEAIESILIADPPDAVLVYGDTNSTIAGALAAAKLHLPVVHVEAGLRSYDRRMPEEVNRVLTDHVSTLLFCPTEQAIANLRTEGIVDGVHLVGDVMYDAMLHARARADRAPAPPVVADRHRPFAVLTLHRAENTDDPARLRALIDYVRQQTSGLDVVFPVHPRTAAAAAAAGVTFEPFVEVSPLSYGDMSSLLGRAQVAYTDSGGLQKEAYFHRVPCVTLRDTTEWGETIDAGWNRLFTTDEWKTPRRDIHEYGDGAAGEAIVDIIVRTIG